MNEKTLIYTLCATIIALGVGFSLGRSQAKKGFEEIIQENEHISLIYNGYISDTLSNAVRTFHNIKLIDRREINTVQENLNRKLDIYLVELQEMKGVLKKLENKDMAGITHQNQIKNVEYLLSSVKDFREKVNK